MDAAHAPLADSDWAQDDQAGLSYIRACIMVAAQCLDSVAPAYLPLVAAMHSEHFVQFTRTRCCHRNWHQPL